MSSNKVNRHTKRDVAARSERRPAVLGGATLAYLSANEIGMVPSEPEDLTRLPAGRESDDPTTQLSDQIASSLFEPTDAIDSSLYLSDLQSLKAPDFKSVDMLGASPLASEALRESEYHGSDAMHAQQQNEDVTAAESMLDDEREGGEDNLGEYEDEEKGREQGKQESCGPIPDPDQPDLTTPCPESPSTQDGGPVPVKWSELVDGFFGAASAMTAQIPRSSSDRARISDDGSQIQSPANANVVRAFEGAVIDGYVKGARVFADLNGNGRLDADEPSGVTDEQGRYALTSTLDLKNVPIISLGGIDQETLVEIDYLIAPAGVPYVTPLSSLAYYAERAGSDFESMLAQFGFDLEYEALFVDPVAAFQSGEDSGEALVAGLMVMTAVSVATGLVGSRVDGSSEASITAGIFEQLAMSNETSLSAGVKAAVSRALDEQGFDLTDTESRALDDSLSPVLNDLNNIRNQIGSDPAQMQSAFSLARLGQNQLRQQVQDLGQLIRTGRADDEILGALAELEDLATNAQRRALFEGATQSIARSRESQSEGVLFNLDTIEITLTETGEIAGYRGPTQDQVIEKVDDEPITVGLAELFQNDELPPSFFDLLSGNLTVNLNVPAETGEMNTLFGGVQYGVDLSSSRPELQFSVDASEFNMRDAKRNNDFFLELELTPDEFEAPLVTLIELDVREIPRADGVKNPDDVLADLQLSLADIQGAVDLGSSFQVFRQDAGFDYLSNALASASQVVLKDSDGSEGLALAFGVPTGWTVSGDFIENSGGIVEHSVSADPNLSWYVLTDSEPGRLLDALRDLHVTPVAGDYGPFKVELAFTSFERAFPNQTLLFQEASSVLVEGDSPLRLKSGLQVDITSSERELVFSVSDFFTTPSLGAYSGDLIDLRVVVPDMLAIRESSAWALIDKTADGRIYQLIGQPQLGSLFAEDSAEFDLKVVPADGEGSDPSSGVKIRVFGQTVRQDQPEQITVFSPTDLEITALIAPEPERAGSLLRNQVEIGLIESQEESDWTSLDQFLSLKITPVLDGSPLIRLKIPLSDDDKNLDDIPIELGLRVHGAPDEVIYADVSEIVEADDPEVRAYKVYELQIPEGRSNDLVIRGALFRDMDLIEDVEFELINTVQWGDRLIESSQVASVTGIAIRVDPKASELAGEFDVIDQTGLDLTGSEFLEDAPVKLSDLIMSIPKPLDLDLSEDLFIEVKIPSEYSVFRVNDSAQPVFPIRTESPEGNSAESPVKVISISVKDMIAEGLSLNDILDGYELRGPLNRSGDVRFEVRGVTKESNGDAWSSPWVEGMFYIQPQSDSPILISPGLPSATADDGAPIPVLSRLLVSDSSKLNVPFVLDAADRNETGGGLVIVSTRNGADLSDLQLGSDGNDLGSSDLAPALIEQLLTQHQNTFNYASAPYNHRLFDISNLDQLAFGSGRDFRGENKLDVSIIATSQEPGTDDIAVRSDALSVELYQPIQKPTVNTVSTAITPSDSEIQTTELQFKVETEEANYLKGQDVSLVLTGVPPGVYFTASADQDVLVGANIGGGVWIFTGSAEIFSSETADSSSMTSVMLGAIHAKNGDASNIKVQAIVTDASGGGSSAASKLAVIETAPELVEPVIETFQLVDRGVGLADLGDPNGTEILSRSRAQFTLKPEADIKSLADASLYELALPSSAFAPPELSMETSLEFKEDSPVQITMSFTASKAWPQNAKILKLLKIYDLPETALLRDGTFIEQDTDDESFWVVTLPDNVLRGSEYALDIEFKEPHQTDDFAIGIEPVVSITDTNAGMFESVAGARHNVAVKVLPQAETDLFVSAPIYPIVFDEHIGEEERADAESISDAQVIGLEQIGLRVVSADPAENKPGDDESDHTGTFVQISLSEPAFLEEAPLDITDFISLKSGEPLVTSKSGYIEIATRDLAAHHITSPLSFHGDVTFDVIPGSRHGDHEHLAESLKFDLPVVIAPRASGVATQPRIDFVGTREPGDANLARLSVEDTPLNTVSETGESLVFRISGAKLNDPSESIRYLIRIGGSEEAYGAIRSVDGLRLAPDIDNPTHYHTITIQNPNAADREVAVEVNPFFHGALDVRVQAVSVVSETGEQSGEVGFNSENESHELVIIAPDPGNGGQSFSYQLLQNDNEVAYDISGVPLIQVKEGEDASVMVRVMGFDADESIALFNGDDPISPWHGVTPGAPIIFPVTIASSEFGRDKTDGELIQTGYTLPKLKIQEGEKEVDLSLGAANLEITPTVSQPILMLTEDKSDIIRVELDDGDGSIDLTSLLPGTTSGEATWNNESLWYELSKVDSADALNRQDLPEELRFSKGQSVGFGGPGADVRSYRFTQTDLSAGFTLSALVGLYGASPEAQSLIWEAIHVDNSTREESRSSESIVVNLTDPLVLTGFSVDPIAGTFLTVDGKTEYLEFIGGDPSDRIEISSDQIVSSIGPIAPHESVILPAFEDQNVAVGEWSTFRLEYHSDALGGVSGSFESQMLRLPDQSTWDAIDFFDDGYFGHIDSTNLPVNLSSASFAYSESSDSFAFISPSTAFNVISPMLSQALDADRPELIGFSTTGLEFISRNTQPDSPAPTRLHGTSGNDLLIAPLDAPAVLHGGNGVNHLVGGLKDDLFIIGGNAMDLIEGGEGSDIVQIAVDTAQNDQSYSEMDHILDAMLGGNHKQLSTRIDEIHETFGASSGNEVHFKGVWADYNRASPEGDRLVFSGSPESQSSIEVQAEVISAQTWGGGTDLVYVLANQMSFEEQGSEPNYYGMILQPEFALNDLDMTDFENLGVYTI